MATRSSPDEAAGSQDAPDAPRSRLPFRFPRPRLRRRGSLGLRTRVTLTFALGAMALSGLLAGTTFALTRTNLLNQQESAALGQSYVNASLVQQGLASGRAPSEIQTSVLSSLRLPPGTRAFIRYEGRWFNSSSDSEDILPQVLRSAVSNGNAARMRYDAGRTPSLAVGLPIPATNAEYFELSDLAELQSTLDTLALSLTGAGALTTCLGAGLGWWASRRSLRPLVEVSHAAEAIAGGRLDTRLEATADPDLGVLASSFNEMARALQERIERDARFASDVSHELRSPLMTLSAAVDVLDKRRDELPERSQSALDLLQQEVDRFQHLVEDLLEISRYDVGAVRLEVNEFRLTEFVMQAVQHSADGAAVPVHVDGEVVGATIRADKRRLARVIANLLDNARKYGEGTTSVLINRVGDRVQIAVEDEGPGVPPDERELIFDRFSRGGVAGRRGVSEGVGLGLSLISEHVRLHGGRIWVEDRLDGRDGARFVVDLPLPR